MKSQYGIANRFFAAVFAAAAFSVATIAPSFADDSWKGPGWYQVFDDNDVDAGEIIMIWTGPYPDEAACTNYVNQKLADAAYVQSMIRKYGDPKDWSFSCAHLEQDLPD